MARLGVGEQPAELLKGICSLIHAASFPVTAPQEADKALSEVWDGQCSTSPWSTGVKSMDAFPWKLRNSDLTTSWEVFRMSLLICHHELILLSGSFHISVFILVWLKLLLALAAGGGQFGFEFLMLHPLLLSLHEKKEQHSQKWCAVLWGGGSSYTSENMPRHNLPAGKKHQLNSFSKVKKTGTPYCLHWPSASQNTVQKY